MDIASLIEFLDANFEQETKRLYRALEDAVDAAAKDPCNPKVTDRSRVAIDVQQNVQAIGYALENARKAAEAGDDAQSVLNSLTSKLVAHQGGVSQGVEAHMHYSANLALLIGEIQREMRKG